MKANQPAWLVALQNDLALITAQAAQQHWPGPTPRSGPYYNFRLEHVQQVEREALHLMKSSELQSADLEVVLAMVWIHDRCKPQYENEDHPACAAAWVRENLAALGFPPGKIETVAFGVAQHAGPPGSLPETALEARLLWDADKLTKLGPLDIVGQLLKHPATPDQRITFTSMALLGLERLEKSRRLVNQFYFEASRLLAKERYTQQKAFYEMLARDVEA